METSLNKERLEGPNPYGTRQRMTLHPLLDEVIDESEGFWPDRLFVFHPAGDSPIVEGDPGQLKTALLNLLDNACKYSPPETVVTITCRTDSEMAVVTVTDQGSGISSGEAESIFEKYRRGSASQGTSGAGLGLWLVRQIIEQQGGYITLAPGPDKGTVATIGLPLSA
ncbi:MAG: sensor histidine kinase [Geobacter sp.]|nr:sensor histidine kinase [Geobacter sp.]